MEIRTAPDLPPHSPYALPWPQTPAEAIAVQKQLAGQALVQDDGPPPRIIAGVDCSYDLKTEISYALVVTMDAGRLQPLDVVRATLPTTFPYVPGLLSFREIPVILKALAALAAPPDLLMVDGQGVAHPRRLGIAAHLGILTGLPSIGVAKSRLTGEYTEPGPLAGAISPLTDRRTGEQIGTVLRSKLHTTPLFISPGHRVSQQTALNLTLGCLRGYRLPEPTRLADKFSKMKESRFTDTTDSLL